MGMDAMPIKPELVQTGVLGDGELRAGKGNMRLVQRAIRNGWPIPDKMKAMVVRQMGMIVRDAESARDKTAAARVLVAADSVNVRRENGPSQHQHVHLHGDTNKPKSLAELAGMLTGQLSENDS